MIASLFISTAIGRIDRRHVLVGLSVLLVLSNLLAALAPGSATLLIGRVLMGVALGGFQSLSVAILMRRVPECDIPRALSIRLTGALAATVLAVPVT